VWLVVKKQEFFSLSSLGGRIYPEQRTRNKTWRFALVKMNKFLKSDKFLWKQLAGATTVKNVNYFAFNISLID